MEAQSYNNITMFMCILDKRYTILNKKEIHDKVSWMTESEWEKTNTILNSISVGNEFYDPFIEYCLKKFLSYYFEKGSQRFDSYPSTRSNSISIISETDNKIELLFRCEFEDKSADDLIKRIFKEEFLKRYHIDKESIGKLRKANNNTDPNIVDPDSDVVVSEDPTNTEFTMAILKSSFSYAYSINPYFKKFNTLKIIRDAAKDVGANYDLFEYHKQVIELELLSLMPEYKKSIKMQSSPMLYILIFAIFDFVGYFTEKKNLSEKRIAKIQDYMNWIMELLDAHSVKFINTFLDANYDKPISKRKQYGGTTYVVRQQECYMCKYFWNEVYPKLLKDNPLLIDIFIKGMINQWNKVELIKMKRTSKLLGELKNGSKTSHSIMGTTFTPKFNYPSIESFFDKIIIEYLNLLKKSLKKELFTYYTL